MPVNPAKVILSRLGEGAQAVVYEAEQERPHRTVALKLLRPQLSGTEVRRRFEREAETLATLNHPGIAVVYEAGVVETEFGPLPYFAMELVRGDKLTAHATTELGQARVDQLTEQGRALSDLEAVALARAQLDELDSML